MGDSSSAKTVAAFVASVRATMARRGMAGEGLHLAAVSGGADSLALLHALHRIGVSLHVVHFDHGTRPSSGSDARFVEREAANLGVPFTCGVLAGSGRPQGWSLEEFLRYRRLEFLEETASRTGAARIATGHTLDDQAETVMMRLISGAGRRGLGGIPPIRGLYVRPLIDRRRIETEAFCAALDLRPRVDPTNADRSILRNAIRAEVLPLLAGRYNARIAETLARMADVMRDEDDFLDAVTSERFAADVSAGRLRLPVDDLVALHPALQRRVLRRLALSDAEQVERVRRLAVTGDTGDALDLPRGLSASLEYGWLVLGRSPSSGRLPEPVTLQVPGSTDLDAWGLRIRAWVAPGRPKEWPGGRSACALDAGSAGGPLVVRRPKPGDRFRPLGMRSAKKLGDFFTDAKVPRAARAKIPVVVSGDEIVWVIGHRIDDRFKVTSATRRVLMLTADTVLEGDAADERPRRRTTDDERTGDA